MSVIIPVYNGQLFIRKALECVFRQDYPAHEIIVINDGSKDGTQEVLDEMKGRILSKTIPNGGVSNARNEGIRMATGEYLAFLDADDIWFRNRLKVFAEFIQKYPEAGFFSSDYVERIPYFGNRLIRHSLLARRREEINFNEPVRLHPLRLILANDYAVTPSSVVVKKTAAEQADLFDAKCKLAEDLDFYLRLAMRAEFVLIKDILMYKRNHSDNMSFNNLKLYLAHKAVLENFLAKQKKFIETEGFSGELNKAISRVSYMAGNLQFESGHRREAFILYGEALTLAPSLGNYLNFFYTVMKKSVRLLTADKLSRKNLRKIAS